MSKKIDDRFPNDLGKDCLASIPAVKTPWDRLISFHDAYHYALRHNASMGAVFMQILRVLIPDYDQRMTAMCRNMTMASLKGTPAGEAMKQNSANLTGAFPFINGYQMEMIQSDHDDETILLAGRVVDYNHYRFEKELDTCPADIIGSEYCRITTYAFGQLGNVLNGEDGIPMDLHMVEARGCGDLHCRLVGENREKYPMPPKEKIYDVMGPIATADQIQPTPEEECFKEVQCFRSECGYKSRNGLNKEFTVKEMWEQGAPNLFGTNMIVPSIIVAEPDEEKRKHLTKCMFEATGKMTFSEFAAIKGVREWLGVPADVNDGRVLGGLIEVVLQAINCPYTVEAFNREEDFPPCLSRYSIGTPASFSSVILSVYRSANRAVF